jgi:hypothetical protein
VDIACVCWTLEDLNLFFTSRLAKDNQLAEHQRLLMEETKKSESSFIYLFIYLFLMIRDELGQKPNF